MLIEEIVKAIWIAVLGAVGITILFAVVVGLVGGIIETIKPHDEDKE